MEDVEDVEDAAEPQGSKDYMLVPDIVVDKCTYMRTHLTVALHLFRLCMQLALQKFRTLPPDVELTLGLLERRFLKQVRHARALAVKLHGEETTAHADALRHATLSRRLCRPLSEAADLLAVMAMPL